MAVIIKNNLARDLPLSKLTKAGELVYVQVGAKRSIQIEDHEVSPQMKSLAAKRIIAILPAIEK